MLEFFVALISRASPAGAPAKAGTVFLFAYIVSKITFVFNLKSAPSNTHQETE